MDHGLTSEEATRRLAADGPNILPLPRHPPAWRHLLRQFVEFFAVMLWVAAGLAFVAGLPQLTVAIIVVVLLNGVFAFVQEHRAERAADRLADLLPRRVTVRRDGVRQEIDASELVRGDLVLLDAGDRISADLSVLVARGLKADTSAMTGESRPVQIGIDDTLHAGCFVVEGEGEAVVMATGSSTRLAGIASLTSAGRRPRSPLTRELRRVVQTIAVIAVGVGASFFVLSLLLGSPASDGLVFAIGVTVALVPEGLLPTVTLSLALGGERLARRQALVRRLESVETLGSVTFICTDKTGTLTTNQMTAVDVWTPAGSAAITGPGYGPDADIAVSARARPVLGRAALAAARCSTGAVVEEEDGRWAPRGDTMEAALVALAHRVGVDVDGDRRRRPDGERFPFDPRRRRMSVEVGGELLVKGAPDSVLPRCGPSPGAMEEVERMSARGLRVLAIATRPVGNGLAAEADRAEQHLELLALIGLEDPPRPGVADAVASCRAAGILVAMVTGDHPATARAIATEIGLAGPDGLVVVGRDLPQDDELLAALVDRDGIVLARIDPEHKLRIAEALQRRGHVVAMTGDGVNDGPALQVADIGIAMGTSGTDVAREASDLVLLEEDFAVIVGAVEQGRATFANIGRFLTYHLSGNVAELLPFLLWVLSGSRFPLMIGVLQVLAIDIAADTLPAVALGAEPPGAHLLERPPAGGRLLDRRVATRAFGRLGPAVAAMELLAFLVSLVGSGWSAGQSFPGGATLAAASGAAWMAIVVGQVANAFNCRSSVLPAWRRGWFTNQLLLAALAAEAVIVAVLLFVPPVADLLGQRPPTVWGWLVVVATFPAVIAVDAVDKAFRRRRRRAGTVAAPPALVRRR